MTRSDASKSPRRSFPWRRLLLSVGAAIVALAMSCASVFVCLPAWLRWGIVVDTCPAGTPVATAWVNASGLRRGQWRNINIGAEAHYTVHRADADWSTELRYPSVDLVLVSPAGDEQPLEPRKSWSRSWSGSRQAEVMLPADLPDGDYTLRATADSRLGTVTTDAPLPLYAPARVHVLSDRPLYEPGNSMQLRAVVLRAADLVPLAARPGTWIVSDPSGTVLLEERAQADEWGVVSGSFPLDGQADSGDWQIRWDSGEASGATTVRVEPFTLPRFRVEASADRPWYGPGDQPAVTGRVVYASGAPVALAQLSLRWQVQGAWPPPTAWTDGEADGLPTTVTTDSSGTFALQLPDVPADLVGQASLVAAIDAVDPAGDRVRGGLSLLLSQDRIQVQAVTDLGDGLVEGFNNRLYLRATNAAGQPLRDVDLVVRRAWDPGDEGERTHTDVDGVAALQVDPGPAINVIVPPVPARPPPRAPALATPSVRDLLEGRTVALIDQRTIDGWTGDLEACARFVSSGSETASLVLRVAESGGLETFAPNGAAAECLAQALTARRLPTGKARLLQVTWPASNPDIPRLSLSTRAWPQVPGPLQRQLDQAALDARRCLPDDAGSTPLPRRLQWQLSAGSRAVATRWLPRSTSYLPAAAVSCVEQRFERLALALPSSDDVIGVVDIDLQQAQRVSVRQPQATTMLGYELAVSAHAGDEDLGSTILRLSPGAVPTVRLRATPVLPQPGAKVVVEILRGPDFEGELPEKLVLEHQSGKRVVADIDQETRSAAFELPDKLEGWFSVSWYGATTRVFVRPAGELSVTVEADRQRYAPGDTATLSVTTTQGQHGAQAAVGLIGVDETLGQLVPLPGADALESLRDPVTTDMPAFGSLDGQALTLGRIQGDNAATATVLRVSQLPSPAETDTDVGVSHYSDFDPVLTLSDHFYTVLAELHVQVRAWEAAAVAGQQLSNLAMAELWRDARDACVARDEDVSDAYGRPLRLHWLPEELLALTDPRVVIIDGTRLPEDVVGWSRWVAEEEPR